MECPCKKVLFPIVQTGFIVKKVNFLKEISDLSKTFTKRIYPSILQTCKGQEFLWNHVHCAVNTLSILFKKLGISNELQPFI